jgi:hypothetical protein
VMTRDQCSMLQRNAQLAFHTLTTLCTPWYQGR